MSIRDVIDRCAAPQIQVQILRDGSSDRSAGCPKLRGEVENAPCCRTFQRSMESGSLTNPHPSDHVPVTAPGPNNGVVPGSKGKSQSAKTSSMMLTGSLSSPATKSTFSSSTTARMV